MIRTNYFREIHITIEKIIIVNTQPAHEVLRKSPEGPTGDSQGINTKIDDFMKNCFSEVIVFVWHIYFCFLQEEQILKSYKRGRP